MLYGRRLVILAITDTSEMGLYEVPMYMFLLGLGMGIMLPTSICVG